MKRLVCYALLLAMVVLALPVNALAAENADVIYFEDGSYITIEIEEMGSRASGSITGSKSYTYKASDGAAQWKATVTGTFSYDGSSATCTAASSSVTIYKTDWYTVSKSASKSGNTATANVTMGRKVAGVTVDTKSTSVPLSCDKDGNLS